MNLIGHIQQFLVRNQRNFTGTSTLPKQQRKLRTRRLLCDENGEDFIYGILYPELETCKEQLRISRDASIQLVNLMIEMHLLEDERFIKVVEQAGRCLWTLARATSYRGAKISFNAPF